MPSRRRLLAAASAGTVALAGCSGGPHTGSERRTGSDEWPTLGHDERNTRYAPGAPGPRGGASVEWRREVGIGTGPPTVAEGTVFAPVGDDILALAADTGELRWRVDPQKESASYWSPPRIHGGVAYIAGDERVQALDVETGEEEWVVTFEDSMGALAPTMERDGDALFVGAGETVYRLRATDGKIEWSRRLFGQIRRTMALTAPFLFVATEGGDIYALSPEDGSGYWRTGLPDGVQCEPTATGQRVYVGCMDGRLYAIGRRGQIEWSTEIGGFAKGGIGVVDGTVYADGGRNLHAVDEEGDRQWAIGVGTTGDHPPVIAGDVVFTGGAKLHALKPGGGVGLGDRRIEPAWYTASPGDYVGPMAVAEDRLYAFVRTERDDERRTEFVAFA